MMRVAIMTLVICHVKQTVTDVDATHGIIHKVDSRGRESSMSKSTQSDDKR